MRDPIYVIFDGTSHYIVEAADYNEADPDMKIVATYYDIGKADRAAQRLNEQCIEKYN